MKSLVEKNSCRNSIVIFSNELIIVGKLFSNLWNFNFFYENNFLSMRQLYSYTHTHTQCLGWGYVRSLSWINPSHFMKNCLQKIHIVFKIKNAEKV